MRKLTGFRNIFVKVLSVALILFQLYTTGVRVFSDIIQRSVHLAFVLTLVFIMKPMRKNKDLDRVPWYDILFAVLSAACCIYVTTIYGTIVYQPLQWISTLDKVFAVILVFLILEASRRSVGWTFPILAIAFLIYAYFGEIFPGVWRHQNFSFNKIFQTLYHNGTGIWGTMLGLSAGMLAMFSIFSAILAGTGGAETFIKMGQRIAGKSTGGSGKIAVIASGLFGLISGSAMGNVVATGVFTIPSMKRAGYSNEWAATIEAVASTGGQIMPPIMGAGAFIMAQLIGMNYLDIAKAAIIPAVLFYGSAFVAIHLVSLRDGIKGTDEKPFIKPTAYFTILVPLAVFMFFLLRGYTVTMGAFWATLLALLVYVICFFIETRHVKDTAKKTVGICFETCTKGASSIVEMCGILAGSQIVISLISLTGFATKLSSLIVALGQQNVFLCLVCSMLVCTLLGMGLPTTAAYVLGASVLSPALITLGISPLASHLFVFYYACLSAITPPVCVAVFMASGLAKSNWFKTGILACMVALPIFIIPYTFTYNSSLLMDGSLFNIIFAAITGLVGVVLINFCTVGYIRSKINWFIRIGCIVGGILMLFPDVVPSLIGLAIGAVFFLIGYRQPAKAAKSAE
mgnify:CR=1 FL=1